MEDVKVIISKERYDILIALEKAVKSNKTLKITTYPYYSAIIEFISKDDAIRQAREEIMAQFKVMSVGEFKRFKK